MNLTKLGWNSTFNQEFEQFKIKGYLPARIAREERSRYLVYSEHGELPAEVAGRLLHEANSKSELPAVGDWVALKYQPGDNLATIHGLLPRKSSFSRKTAGVKTEEQVVAANVDILFIVSGLDGDYNPRRIERYLTLAWNSGASPVIVLNKSDLCDDIVSRMSELEAIAFGIPIHPLSAREQQGLEALEQYFAEGKTMAMVGSSGVGKSSIINRLLGEERQEVNDVREDDSRGRHTTTRRELIFLPQGGLIIDNPGMREIQLWTDEESLQETFEDIEAIADTCRFRDCRHQNEPGCAIREALRQGTLDRKRFQNYQKMQKEIEYLERRQNQRMQLNSKARWKQISLKIREIKKNPK